MTFVRTDRALSWRSSISQILATSFGLVAMAVFIGRMSLFNTTIDLESGITRLSAQLAAATVWSSEHPPQADFVNRLPRAPAAAPLLDEFRRAAAAAGVTLSSLTTDARASTERTLGRVQTAVVLRGSYPAVKAAIAQVAARFPNLVFQRVSVRRLATPTDVEARVDTVLPAPPERRAGDSLPSS